MAFGTSGGSTFGGSGGGGGFGLNYNQGFQSGPTNSISPDLSGPAALQNYAFGQNQARQAGALQTALQGAQLASQQGIAAGQQAGETSRLGMSLGTQKELQGQQLASQAALQTQALGSQAALQSGQLTAQQQRQAESEAAQSGLQTQSLASQQGIASQAQSAETQRANIAAQAALAPTQLKQQEFGQLFPLISGAYNSLQGQIGSGGSGGSGTGGGGATGGGPTISAAPVYNPQQIQQQVNQSRAQTDASAGNQMKQNAQSLAGRGFGANSPLLASLNQNAAMQAMNANANAETNLRLGAASTNAQQVLAGQQAQQQQYAANQQYGLGQQQIAASRQNALIAALAGLA